jgi:hypothetical protein
MPISDRACTLEDVECILASEPWTSTTRMLSPS